MRNSIKIPCDYPNCNWVAVALVDNGNEYTTQYLQAHTRHARKQLDAEHEKGKHFQTMEKNNT